MAYHTRKTFNDSFGQSPLDREGPSGPLQFMRNRRAIGWSSIITPPGWTAGWTALSAPFEVGRAAVKTVRFLEKLGQSKPEYATPMVDTRQAYTMRQAALQTMHNSAYSIRSAIGQEARMLHS